MAIVKFTSNLKRFYPNLTELQVEAETISKLLDLVNKEYPGIKNYIVDDQNNLRHHVNIFKNDIMINDRIKLSDKISTTDEILIVQALSGG